MSHLDRATRALKNPVALARGLNRAFYRRAGRRSYNTDGVDLFGEDWDSLLILDACRYDLFSARSDLPGRLESRRSRGSATAEFLHANFTGKDLTDTVYVTANPQYRRHRDALDATFHAVVDVGDEAWDSDLGTVLPEDVAEATLDAAEEYPEKRLLVHFLQPHYPFITAADEHEAFQGFTTSLWEGLFTGDLDLPPRDVKRAYAHNLDRALPSIRSLLETLDGRTVVTADHGNMLGERAFPIPIREWGHPRGIYTDHLVRVPWLVSENGPRRTITADPPVSETTDDDGTIDDRLAALGYVE